MTADATRVAGEGAATRHSDRAGGAQVNGALVSLNVIAYKSRASLDRRWGVDSV